jgi:hypothetical protein
VSYKNPVAKESRMNPDWMDPKIVEQQPLNEAITTALIDFIPASWRSAKLELNWLPDSGSISQRVVCPDTGEGWTVSQELIEAVFLLDQHRRKFALGWRAAVYSVRLDKKGVWQAAARFTFE